MKAESRTDLKDRTRAFALQTVRLQRENSLGDLGVLGVSIPDSGPEFVSKLEGALQELEETRYWLDLMTDAGVVAGSEIAGVAQEARELTAILVTCIRRVKDRRESEAR